MKLKVCHMTSAHDRDDIRIFVKECMSLFNGGYDVTFIVNDNRENDIVNGVKIVSTNFEPKNRFERFIISRKFLLQKAIEVDADIYHLHDPDLLPIGNKLIKKNKKVIFDSHEDIPKQIIDKFWIPKLLRGLIANIYAMYEKYSLKLYSGVIGPTPRLVDRLSTINPYSVTITNYPIIDKDLNMDRKPEFAICFAGMIQHTYCHDNVLKAIESIDGLKYILAGKPNSYLEYLKKLPAWEKVEYMGWVTLPEVKKIYSRSFAGIALNYSNQDKGEGTLGGNKLFEFMEAGLPVICTGDRLWREVVEGNNCGICVDPNNVKEVENAIRFLIENPDKAKIMGENGRKAVIEKYSWNSQEKILLDFYSKLII